MLFKCAYQVNQDVGNFILLLFACSYVSIVKCASSTHHDIEWILKGQNGTPT
jgi:hypothetical protein